MPEELEPEPAALVSSFDEAGHVGDDEPLLRSLRHPEVRLERRERIRRDLRPGRGQAGQQRGLACVRKSDQADVGHQAKLELEQKKKGGAEITADLQADFDKREAEFNLAWKKLQERITVTAKASEDKITASVAYLKKDKNDKDSVKAGVDAEVDLKALQGQLKAYYASPSIEAALQVTAAGYQNQTKPVQVPARSVNEYRVALTP